MWIIVCGIIVILYTILTIKELLRSTKEKRKAPILDAFTKFILIWILIPALVLLYSISNEELFLLIVIPLSPIFIFGMWLRFIDWLFSS